VLGPFEVQKRPLTLRPKFDTPAAPGGPSAGLVAWWKLDETTGTAVGDAAGKCPPATVRGAARWGPGQGRRDGALEFTGANVVDCGDQPGFDFREGLTVAFWVKAAGAPKPGKTAQTLITKGGASWSVRRAGAEGRLVFGLTGPETTGKDRRKAAQLTATRRVDDGQWHHVAGTYDGQRMALYLDGVLDASLAASGSLGLTTEPLWLGNNPVARSEAFTGWLDDLRLYRRGLTEVEIKALHQGVSQ
jgi:hypothetical protein